MGYELHIIRQDDYEEWADSNIAMEEWLAYIETDKELVLTNGYFSSIPGIEPEWQDSPGYCEWIGHGKSDAGTIPWFDYGNGFISAKYPDPQTIKKMIAIAASLNARVCGDDYEFYDETYFTNGGYPIAEGNDEVIEDITEAITRPTKDKKKSWWKFW